MSILLSILLSPATAGHRLRAAEVLRMYKQYDVEMFNKLLVAIAPAGSTFGVLFIADATRESTRLIGAGLVTVTLLWMYRTILNQQRDIAQLATRNTTQAQIPT